MRAVTAAEMRRIEEDAIAAGTTVEELMQRAGRAVADAVGEALGGRVVGRRVLVLAGPGKNGGDGLIAARILRQRGARVSVVCPIPRADNDPLLEECGAAGCSITQGDVAGISETLSRVELIVDALLGTGRSRAIEGPILDALDAARGASGATVVAVDVPSGLDSDSGEVDPATLAADFTVALGSVKVGCLTVKGAEICGQIRVADIGLGALGTGDSGVAVLTAQEVAGLLPERRAAGHKGTFGKSIVIGGSRQYRGAPALAAQAALRVGAGTVAIAAPAFLTATLAPMIPEATHEPLSDFEPTWNPDPSAEPEITSSEIDSELLEAWQQSVADAMRIWSEQIWSGTRSYPPPPHADALLMGPGMGQNPLVGREIDRLFNGGWGNAPSVLDADALTTLGGIPMWWKQVKAPTILTPHPGEMARLCYMSTQDVQARRLTLADENAKEWGVTVVLKGAYTVVASPDEPPSICPLALPALASGGTGDALAGIITGFLSQGLTTSAAARAGVYVHGTAAALAAQANGNMTSGLLASDLIEKIPVAMDVIRRGKGPVPPMFA